MTRLLWAMGFAALLGTVPHNRPATADDPPKALAVPFHHQLGTAWCWAAVAEMTMEYHLKALGKPGWTPRQCDMVNRVFSPGIDCCAGANSTRDDCNRPSAPPYSLYGFNERGVTAIGAVDLQHQIDSVGPVSYNVSFPGAASKHYKLVRGLFFKNHNLQILSFDPSNPETVPPAEDTLSFSTWDSSAKQKVEYVIRDVAPRK